MDSETEIRICNKCEIEKPVKEFAKRKRGIVYKCKTCANKITREWYRKNKEKKRLYDIQYRKDHKKERREYDRQRDKNITNVYKRRYANKKRKNPMTKLIWYQRSRIGIVLSQKGKIKKDSTMKLIGCTKQFFIDWVEWQLEDDMTWDNYGTYWHVDHVIACSSFDLTNKEEQLKCFSWKNLQPLKKFLNLSKHNKIINKYILLQEFKVKMYERVKINITELKPGSKNNLLLESYKSIISKMVNPLCNKIKMQEPLSLLSRTEILTQA